jgi:multimeric flavodoxin WrbA
MLILGIVGSPRKDGRTNALIDAALQGARGAGADTRTLYLVDHDIKPFTGRGDATAAQSFCPEAVSAACEEADALVLGAPVYFGDINGLTKDFMDTVRIGNENGKPALGTAIAGGSGKGLLSGVQSIYHWFYHRQMRAIDPTPVTRFNWDSALESLRASGASLVDAVNGAQPFPGERRNDRWAHVLAHYATLPHFRADPVDEFVLLAEQLVENTAAREEADEDDVMQARADLAEAQALAAAGERAEAGRYAVAAYERLYF